MQHIVSFSITPFFTQIVSLFCKLGKMTVCFFGAGDTWYARIHFMGMELEYRLPEASGVDSRTTMILLLPELKLVMGLSRERVELSQESDKYFAAILNGRFKFLTRFLVG